MGEKCTGKFEINFNLFNSAKVILAKRLGITLMLAASSFVIRIGYPKTEKTLVQNLLTITKLEVHVLF